MYTVYKANGTTVDTYEVDLRHGGKGIRYPDMYGVYSGGIEMKNEDAARVLARWMGEAYAKGRDDANL